MCMRMRKVLSAEGVDYVKQNITALMKVRTLEEMRAYLVTWNLALDAPAPECASDDDEAEDAA